MLEGALDAGALAAIVFALISVLHLRAEDVTFKRLRRLVLLVACDGLLADGVQLFLNREVRLVLALGHLLEPRLVQLSASVHLRVRLCVH